MKGIHQNETTIKHCEALPTRQTEHSRSKQRHKESVQVCLLIGSKNYSQSKHNNK